MAEEKQFTGEGQAELTLGINIDKAAFEEWEKRSDRVAKKLKSLGEEVDTETGKADSLADSIRGVGRGFQGAAGLIASALGALATLGVGKLTKEAAEAEKLMKRLLFVVGETGPKIARKLSKTLNIPKKEIEKQLIDTVELYKYMGLSKRQSASMAAKMITRARDVSAKTGVDYNKVLAAMQGFVKTGKIGAVSKIMGHFGMEQQELFDSMNTTFYKWADERQKMAMRGRFVMSRTRGAQGAFGREVSTGKNLDAIDRDLANAKTAIIDSLTPALQDLSLKVSKLTAKIEPLANDISKKVSVLIKEPALGAAAVGVAAIAIKFLPWGKILGLLPYAAAGGGAAWSAWKNREDILEKSKEKGGEYWGKIKEIFKDISDKTKERFKQSIESEPAILMPSGAIKGAPISGKGAMAAPVTNNFKISVSSPSADPMEVAKTVERVFDNKFRSHLGTLSSGVS